MPAKEQFENAIGETFQIGLEPEAVELQLQELDDRGSREVGERVVESYSLMFHGPADFVLPQGTYYFSHDSLGKFEIFIVPIGPDDSGMRYQAVFN